MIKCIRPNLFGLLLAGSLTAGSPVVTYQEAIAADQNILSKQENKQGSSHGRWEAAPHSYETLVAAPSTLIPFPREVVWNHKDVCVLPKQVSIHTDQPELQPEAKALAQELSNHGIKADQSTKASTAMFKFRLAPDQVKQPEGYWLRIGKGGCEILAHDRAGAYYAIKTIRQLVQFNGKFVQLTGCEIKDAPAFKIRGFMHDVGRNFQTIESLKKQIDHFANYKLNVFHWHLTDHPAWRIQSKLFPELNDPKNRRKGRDPESTYSFEQIRELIAYARQRHVMIIPELDMPGHSEYFQNTFGFKMGTPEGMEVLEKLIDEFCSEIPVTDCPYLHLGADEVKIPDPDGFIKRMTDKVRENGRIPILWNPGLKPTDAKTVVQLWNHTEYKETMEGSENPIIDSAGGYINNTDPLQIVGRYFFWQACERPGSDKRAMGGILCHWPDVNVNEKENIFRHSPVWPAVVAFSESIWQGRSKSAKRYMNQSPAKGTEAWMFLREFEARVADHRDRYFSEEAFPYAKPSGMEWMVSRAYPHSEGDSWDKAFAPELDQKGRAASDKDAKWKARCGASVNFSKKATPVPSTRYLRTYLHADQDREVYLMAGFDTPRRFKRRGPGVPPQGKWDANGGTIWLNGSTLTPPQWINPGQFRNEKMRGLSRQAHETPFTDEEFYWCREPVKVELQKGLNVLLMRVPYVYEEQAFQASCVPVKKHQGRWVEDESVKGSVKAGGPNHE